MSILEAMERAPLSAEHLVTRRQRDKILGNPDTNRKEFDALKEKAIQEFFSRRFQESYLVFRDSGSLSTLKDLARLLVIAGKDPRFLNGGNIHSVEIAPSNLAEDEDSTPVFSQTFKQIELFIDTTANLQNEQESENVSEKLRPKVFANPDGTCNVSLAWTLNRENIRGIDVTIKQDSKDLFINKAVDPISIRQSEWADPNRGKQLVEDAILAAYRDPYWHRT